MVERESTAGRPGRKRKVDTIESKEKKIVRRVKKNDDDTINLSNDLSSNQAMSDEDTGDKMSDDDVIEVMERPNNQSSKRPTQPITGEHGAELSLSPLFDHNKEATIRAN